MPVRVRLVRVKKAKMPNLKIPKKIKEEIALVANAAIIDNVRRQKQADGTPLKINPPTTREYKRKKGWTVGGRVRSLIAEEHRFVKMENWKRKIGFHSITIQPIGELKKLVKYVQQKGYTGWFDLSKKGMAAVRQILREWVKAEFKKAARK